MLSELPGETAARQKLSERPGISSGTQAEGINARLPRRADETHAKEISAAPT